MMLISSVNTTNCRLGKKICYVLKQPQLVSQHLVNLPLIHISTRIILIFNTTKCRIAKKICHGDKNPKILSNLIDPISLLNLVIKSIVHTLLSHNSSYAVVEHDIVISFFSHLSF